MWKGLLDGQPGVRTSLERRLTHWCIFYLPIWWTWNYSPGKYANKWANFQTLQYYYNHHLFSSVSATSSRSSCLSNMSASNSSRDDNSPAGVISGSVSSNFTLALLLDNCNWYFIKGQCHEIFNIRFFSWIVFPTAPDIQFAPFQKYSKLVKILKTQGLWLVLLILALWWLLSSIYC